MWPESRPTSMLSGILIHHPSKEISIAHDLTPQQRERVKEVRRKAMDELQEQQQKDARSANKGNVSIS